MVYVVPLPQPSIGEAFRLFFKNYGNFSGRSRRSEYWKVFVAQLIISITFCICVAFFAFTFYNDLGYDLAHALGHGFTFGFRSMGVGIIGMVALILYCIYALFCLIPTISISVRRLHDIGLSGWWLVPLFVVSFIPIISFIAFIVSTILYCIDGKAETNQWGPSPKYVVE